MRYDAVDANVTSATVGTPSTAIDLPPAKPPSGNFLETAAPLTMAHIDNIALGGGIYGGWNYQITEDYVAGVEADFGWANETANLHGSLHRSCSTSESDWAVALASEQSLTALPVVIAHDKAALLVPQVQGHRSLLNQHIGGTAHTKKTSGVVIRSHQEKSMRIRGWADQISFGKAMQWPYSFP